MKRVYITLGVLLTAVVAILTGCQRDRAELQGGMEGDRVPVSLSIDVPYNADLREAQDGIDENKVSSLELLIFDKKGLMIDYARAIELRPVTTSGGEARYSFKALVKPQQEECVIHFVANRNYGGNDAAAHLIGRTESNVLFSQMVQMSEVITTKQIPMWARVTYPNIVANQRLGKIRLIRSMAKVTLALEGDAVSKLQDVSYRLFNSYKEGSVAPFDATKLGTSNDYAAAFGNADQLPTVVTEQPWVSADRYASDKPIYLFERDNKSLGGASAGVAQPAFVIIQARYNGNATPTYYKLEFVDSDNRILSYDILRNYHYQIIISDVLAGGYATEQEAIDGPALNNLAISEHLQPYPSFFDRNGRLEVARTNYLFTGEDQSFTFQANFYPDNGNTQTENGKLRVLGVRNPNKAIAGSKDQITIDAEGKVTVPLNQPTSDGELVSDIILGVEGHPSLMRVIRVKVRKPYIYKEFSANGVKTNRQTHQAQITVPRQQQTPVKFKFTLPDDFDKRLLPIRLRFFTEHFYPDVQHTDPDMGRFSFGIKDGRSCYTIIVSRLEGDRTLECTFLSNKSACAETIEVVSVDNLFNTQKIQVTPQQQP